MAEALGGRARVAAACGNLGIRYFRMGEYARAHDVADPSATWCSDTGWSIAGLVVPWRGCQGTTSFYSVTRTVESDTFNDTIEGPRTLR